MDMGQYGKKIEEFLESKGEVIQRISISTKELEDNYLIDKDGVITLVPKIGGQVLNWLLQTLSTYLTHSTRTRHGIGAVELHFPGKQCSLRILCYVLPRLD